MATMSARRRRAVSLLLLLPLLAGSANSAPPEPAEVPASTEAALAVYDAAVSAQGKLRGEAIEHVHMLFRGAITEEGTHTIVREFWYRATDRSFRLVTKSTAHARLETDRGVSGADGYWDRTEAGEVLTLSRGNRDHKEIMRTIEKERDEFEGMLRIVLLARLGDGSTSFHLESGEPVLLEQDQPFEARSILGSEVERKKWRYDILAITRKGDPPAKLYVRTTDRTVRLAVIRDAENPEAGDWHYYFGPFVRSESGLVVPQYLSAHRGRPLDAETKQTTNKARGELLKVEINTPIADSDLRPVQKAAGG